ncbi:acyltransferase domain-containing protein [Thiocapsa bogorovii]|uniref:acyltransferase domain-containing protein n=1 Tax=Thiocapsa bogorovii TaxID=521689 RepID=UPI001E33648E|nr:acyltransferase domain-containing protein [Thiocapsa bogorovii]UHD14543.1 polyketide synthase dehydratase domain-containing protein [Thiocapsa bogorovii]
MSERSHQTDSGHDRRPIAITDLSLQVGRLADVSAVWNGLLAGRPLESTTATLDQVRFLSSVLRGLATPEMPGSLAIVICDSSAPGAPVRRRDLEATLTSSTSVDLRVWSQGGGSEACARALDRAGELMREGFSQVMIAACELDRGAVVGLMPLSAAVSTSTPVFAVIDRGAVQPAVLRLGSESPPAKTELGSYSAGERPAPWWWSPEYGLHLSQTFTSVLPLAVAALALRERIIPPYGPPQSGTRSTGATPWVHGFDSGPRRADIVLRTDGSEQIVRVRAADETGVLLQASVTAWPAEPFLIAAGSAPALRAEIANLAERLMAAPSIFSMTALAESVYCAEGAARLGFVAADRQELADRLRVAADLLDGVGSPMRAKRIGVHLSLPDPTQAGMQGPPSVAFMAPGIGSAYPGILRGQALSFPPVMDTLDDFATAWPGPAGDLCARLYRQDSPASAAWNDFDWSGAVGSMAVMASAGLLARAGVEPDTLLGFSNGEMAALLLAGAMQPPPGMSRERLIWDTAASGRSRRSDGLIRTGRMVAVHLVDQGRKRLAELLECYTGRVFLAIDASPKHVVLFGLAPEIDAVIAALDEDANICLHLPFDRPFHTPLYRDELEPLERLLAQLGYRKPETRIWSCAANAPYPSDPQRFPAVVKQALTGTVRFREAIESLYARGLRTFVEIGGRSQLVGYTKDVLRRRPATLVGLDREGGDGARIVLDALATLFVAGVRIDLSRLRPGPAHRMDWGIVPEPDADERNLTEWAQASPPEAWGEQDPAEDTRAPDSPGNASGFAHGPPQGLTPERIALMHRQLALTRQFIETQERVALGLIAAARARRPPQVALPERTWRATSDGLFDGPARKVADAIELGLLLEPDRDTHLDHHRLGRVPAGEESRPERPLPVMAMVMALEVMAQAARELVGGGRGERFSFSGVDGLLGKRWISVPQRQSRLCIHLQRRHRDADGLERISVALFTPPTQDGDAVREAVTAQVVLGTESIRLEPVETWGEPLATAWSMADFNRLALFHGPAFRCLDRLIALREDGLELTAVAPQRDRLFGPQRHGEAATPAALLDAVGQAVAFWLLARGTRWFTAFPVGIDRYRQTGDIPESGDRVACAVRVRQQGDALVADASFARPHGPVFARVDGMRLMVYYPFQPMLSRLYWRESQPLLTTGGSETNDRRLVRECPDQLVKDLDLAGGIFVAALARLILVETEHQTGAKTEDGLPARGDTKRTDLLMRLAAKEAAIVWLREHEGHSPDHLDLCVELTEEAETQWHLARVRPFGDWVERLRGRLPPVRIQTTGGRIRAVVDLERNASNDIEHQQSTTRETRIEWTA